MQCVQFVQGSWQTTYFCHYKGTIKINEPLHSLKKKCSQFDHLADIRIFKGMRETIRHGSTKSLKTFPGNIWKMVNVKVPHPVVHPSSRQAGLCRGDWCIIKPHWFCHCSGVCSHWLWHFAVFGLPCEWPALAIPRHPLSFLGSLITVLSVTMLEMESVLRSGPIVADHPKWTA